MYMQKRHLQQASRRDIYVTTCKILLLLFCIWTPYVFCSDYLMLILKFSTIPVGLHDIPSFLNYKTISIQQVWIFITAKIWRYFSITPQLR